MGRADRARRERHSRTHAGSAHALTARLRRPAGNSPSLLTVLPARLARLAGAAAGLLAAGLFLLVVAAAPGPALAQTSGKLVSNTGQTGDGAGKPWFKHDFAQAFDTGDNAEGYTLTSVKMSVEGGADTATYIAHIYLANDQSGHPTGNSLGTLTNPSSLTTDRTYTWTATGGGIDLDPNEGYVLYVDVSAISDIAGTAYPRIKVTTSSGQDSDSASGWDIAGAHFQRVGFDNSGAWQTTAQPMRIELHGYAKVTPRSPFAPVQTAGVLVDNLEVVAGSTRFNNVFTDDIAQAFTTGSAPGGYKLSSARLWLAGTGAWPNFKVEIWTSNPAGSFSRPDTLVGTLTAPASLINAVNTFTAMGGIDLKPNTEYFVVLDVTGTAANHRWIAYVDAPAEIGGAAGWSIADLSLERPGGTWTRILTSGRDIVQRLTIHGYLKNAFPPDAPGQPTVSAVTGKGGQLSVSWDAPANDNGAAVIDYDLRYFKGTSDPTNEADWVEEGFDQALTGIPDPGAARTATLSGLAPSSAYQVQVRAQNDAGEGAWSDSGSATTNAAGTNNAPRLLESKSGDEDNNCQVKSTTTPSATINAPTGTLVSVSPVYNRQASGDTAEWPDACTTTTGTRAVPFFDDRDGETLAYTFSYTLPDNVRLSSQTPRIVASTNNNLTADRFFVRALTAGEATDIRIDVTATDGQGASVSTHFIFQSGSFPNAVGAPSLTAPGLLRFVQNKRGSAVLPAATGGDRPDYGYLYHVDETKLPPGLSFDRETRTISGTPTAAGTWTATYTANDFDGFYSRKDSPTTADTNDAATQTFMVRVEPATGSAPTIQGLWVTSLPGHESVLNSGVYDTYIQKDEILFDVQYDRPVAVSLPKKNSAVRLRIDLGPDTASTTDGSRRTAALKSLEYGGRVLRFAYTVGTGTNCSTRTTPHLGHDCDPDGVWVQTVSATDKKIVFLANDATVVDAKTGVAAGNTLNGLPTEGGLLGGTGTATAPTARVDGSVTSASGVRVASAEIDGKTLTVTFDANLTNTAGVDTALLATELAVQGAGDVQGETVASQHPGWISFGTVTHAGATVTEMVLTLSQPARPGQRVTLFYTGNQLKKGTAQVPQFGQLVVTNVTGGAASVAPAPLYGTAAGSTVTVRFTRALDEDSAPTAGAFQVWTRDRNNDGRSIWGKATATTSVSGDTVTIPLDGRVRADEGVRVSYFKPTTGPVLKDRLLHTEVASWRDFPIYSNHDVTPPEAPSMVMVDDPGRTGRSLGTLYFDKALDKDSVPFGGKFTMRLGGSTGTVQNTGLHAVANNAVTFEAAGDSTAGTTVWHLVYDPDATGGAPIRDEAGNAVAGFTVQSTAVTTTKPAPIAGVQRVDGATLTVRFTGGSYLDPSSVPAAAAFTFHDTETTPNVLDIGIDAVSVTPTELVLLLEDSVPPCAGVLTPNNIASGSPTPSRPPPAPPSSRASPAPERWTRSIRH